MTLTLDCPKCGRRNVLSDDDAVFFYPRFFCLSCANRLAIPIAIEDYLKMLRNPDRDRRIQVDGKAPPAQRPVAPTAKAAAPGEGG